ncbi:Serine phosphatase RsbU, regulator of sigma subunit [hydrothermal vent metagenome]|uniref:Serine phosphatase RsbU, regulator of sigma subunit n=1 Tax=hydrothermal vent metagenome TaxID=652676 RepID=A0A3B1AUB5_9ZZZZ
MSQAATLEQLKPSDLPSPPQAALLILRACSQDNVSSTALSAIAEKDPVLTAELLRIVNTPFFGLSRKVQSLSHAVTILGHRTLRNLVLCLSVRDAVGKDAIPGLDTSAYWEDSLRRAVSAKLLAPQLKQNPDDCFTAGLLQDFGLLVLFYLRPEMAMYWDELRSLDPEARLEAEQQYFGHSHTDVITLLADAWGLPEELGQVLGTHHRCEEAELDQDRRHLCRILLCADWMNAIFSAHDKTSVLGHTQQLLQDFCGMNEEEVGSCLNILADEMELAASSLGLHIDTQPEFEQIMRDANVKLAEANLSYQELTWKLEQTLKERDKLAAELEKELQLAREIQESLLPKKLNDDFPISGLNVSALQLSGDFYDYFVLKDGRIYFNLADVSGKGVYAALLMAKTSSLFHCLGKHIHEPDKLLAHINNELCETAIRGMFVTMIAGIYDPKTGCVKMVNAGNPPALLFSPGKEVQAIEATSSPLGILPKTPFPLAADVYLAEKDCLYLFSDGATEGYLQEGGEMLGLEGLQKLIASTHKLAPKAQLHAIVEKFSTASTTLHDDITIMLIEGKARA